MLALPDDEIVDFVAAGSMRAFTILCLRKLPWLALCAVKAHGDRARAMDGAAHAMVAAWEQAPTWPARSGRLDHRLLDLLDTRPGLVASDPQRVAAFSDEDMAALLRRVVAECAGRPQRRAGWIGRLFG